jgi:L-ascorbate metabolism protein UlaG (beta-lactamase superfamily)
MPNPKNELRLTWYGTAGLLFQANNRSISFDPFYPVSIGGFSRCHAQTMQRDSEDIHTSSGSGKAFGENPYQKATDVFVTHGHFDHIYQIPDIYRNQPVIVHCTRTPQKTLLKHGFPPQKLNVITPGWRGSVGPFTICAYQGRHCRFDLPLLRRTILCRRFWRHPVHLLQLLSIHLSFHEKNEILFYELSCCGKRIQIMGSMNLDPNTDYPTDADVLILPLQGRSDQDTYALEFVKRLRPKSVLLDHYDDAFPPLSSDVDTSGFVRNVREMLGIPCRPLEKNKEIVL